MEILFTIMGLVLLLSGGAGLFLTLTNYPVASLTWLEGTLTYGVFFLLGIIVIIVMTILPRET
ncbi:hypothetical protein ACFLV5_02975 [Chloroflexota bacterium]